MTKRVRNALLKIRDGIETFMFGAHELNELADELESVTNEELKEVLGTYMFVFDALTSDDVDSIFETEYGQAMIEGCNNWKNEYFDEEEA